jgi:uncharacterized membrane protein
MAIRQIIGGETKKQIADAFYTQEAEVEGYHNNVQPVVDVDKPFVNIVKFQTCSASTATLYTTPEDKDFYLTAAFISANSTGQKKITITVNGEAVDILVSYTSACNPDINFSPPIKIDRGTNITMTQIAATSTYASIFGYTKESNIK